MSYCWMINHDWIPRFRAGRRLKQLIMTFVFALTLAGCAVHHNPQLITPKTTSEFQQGKREFENGYYKRAMHMLLPLACDGVGEAEYAVGYMYYYGYGVAQDTDVGSIWINRSAKKGYPPAVHASTIIRKDGPVLKTKSNKWRMHLVPAHVHGR